MELRNGEIGLIVLLAGIPVIIAGFLCFTEIVGLGLAALFYVGVAMIIIGAALCYIDVKGSDGIFEQYDSLCALRKMPDDDYMIDLTGSEQKYDLPEVTDMTKEGGQ